MRYSSLTTRIAGEGADAWMVHDLAMARRERGEDIIVLSLGDPDYDTPRTIRDAATHALSHGRTHYASIPGETPLREAIAAQTKRTWGIDARPEQVTVFPGAQAALYALAQCLLDAGDEVIVPDPSYATYEALLGAPGATMVTVPLRPENGFHLEPDVVAAAITPRTRGLLVNFPHNPTGACLSVETAHAITELCVARDLWCISDEVYAALDHAGRHHSPMSVPGMMERGAVVSSFSKSHAMTGWRCGWTVTSEELAVHLERVARAMFFGVSQFVQDAAVAALADVGGEAAAIRASYVRRAEVVVEELSRAPGLRVHSPDAGLYVFADVRGTGLDGKRFARGLLDAEGVSVTPGEGFGPSGAGHVRITLGVDDERLREACRRIARYATRLADAR
jgi:arginine:pyruvate transaminase